ncbi:hypothetical protein EYF80_000849 [Liparis tanakae]|uniref:Uncharacterized protein n=1 Tax=Liparis tanakae TaxID=230148 RepID=A0A4Z2JG76_9TELE|nr:hypothetical protein EYF80_000849 [Liparis tanakae]
MSSGTGREMRKTQGGRSTLASYPGPPKDFVVQTPNVKADSTGAGFVADDVDGLWGQGGRRLDVGGLEPCWSKLLGHGDGEGDLLGKMSQDDK